jgi:hypothetical protein
VWQWDCVHVFNKLRLVRVSDPVERGETPACCVRDLEVENEKHKVQELVLGQKWGVKLPVVVSLITPCALHGSSPCTHASNNFASQPSLAQRFQEQVISRPPRVSDIDGTGQDLPRAGVMTVWPRQTGLPLH